MCDLIFPGLDYIVALLIEKKSEVNGKDDDGNTPLHYAAEGGDFLHAINFEFFFNIYIELFEIL